MHPTLPCGHTALQDRCPYCRALQARWYGILNTSGFEEAENVELKTRPLKVWAGVSITSIPNKCLQGAVIECVVSSEEMLLNHPGFDKLCEDLCRHGNYRGTPGQIRKIWEAYTEGTSKRSIAARLGLNDTFVWRVVRALTQWMELMDLEETQDADRATVVVREFKPTWDEAFVYASWRNCLWYDDDKREAAHGDRFFRRATKSIRAVLENPQTRVRIACLSDSADFIVGYSVTTSVCLQFVYVKADYRGRGIGTLLVPKDVECLSPVMTKIGRAIAIKKKLIKGESDGETEGFEE